MPKCAPDEVYHKASKKCVVFGGKNHMAIVKADPGAFASQVAKSLKIIKSKHPTWCPEPGKVYSEKSKRCITIGGAVHLKQMKEAASLKKAPSPKKSVTVTRLAKQVFMNRVRKILRRAGGKDDQAVKELDMKKIPSQILVKKTTEIHLYHFDYFPDDATKISETTFRKDKGLQRKMTNIKVYHDNISSRVYRHILKTDVNPNVIDLEWFLSTQTYIKSLTDRQRYALFSYTHKGDVYMNLMERDLPVDFSRVDVQPLFYEYMVYMAEPESSRVNIYTNPLAKMMPPASFKEFIEDTTGKKMMSAFNQYKKSRAGDYRPAFLLELIRRLADTLSGVVKKAPPTKKTMVVYRGVKDAFFTANDFTAKPKPNEVYYNRGFVSTSIQYTVALHNFTDENTACCFKVITILPGTRCVPLIGLSNYPKEAEILLDRNVKFIIRDKYQALVPMRGKVDLTNNGSRVPMKISDIIIG